MARVYSSASCGMHNSNGIVLLKSEPLYVLLAGNASEVILTCAG